MKTDVIKIVIQMKNQSVDAADVEQRPWVHLCETSECVIKEGTAWALPNKLQPIIDAHAAELTLDAEP